MPLAHEILIPASLQNSFLANLIFMILWVGFLLILVNYALKLLVVAIETLAPQLSKLIGLVIDFFAQLLFFVKDFGMTLIEEFTFSVLPSRKRDRKEFMLFLQRNLNDQNFVDLVRAHLDDPKTTTSPMRFRQMQADLIEVEKLMGSAAKP